MLSLAQLAPRPAIPRPTSPANKLLKKLPATVEEHRLAGRSLRLMFQDEARFGRINDPRRCWAPRGVRPQVCARIVREYTYVFAAVSPHDGTLDTLVLPEVNALTMSLFWLKSPGVTPRNSS